MSDPIESAITGEHSRQESAWAEHFSVRPPVLCMIGADGSVTWTEHANPVSIGKIGGPDAATLLALWYATNGENKP